MYKAQEARIVAAFRRNGWTVWQPPIDYSALADYCTGPDDEAPLVSAIVIEPPSNDGGGVSS